MTRRRSLCVLGLLAASALQALPASALTATPTITIGRVGGTTYDVGADGTLSAPDVNGVQTWTYGGGTLSPNYTVDAWTVQLEPDPFVTNNLTLTNTSGVTSTFVATVLLPISSFAYNSVINSSVGVTATDSNGDGTLLFDVSGATPIYNGFVNFPSSTTLLGMNPIGPGTLPITTADCPIVFNGCTATSSNGVASLGVTPGSTSLIGLTLMFQLSPGDSVGLTSRFEIANTPEPATVGLLGSALAGIALARRRPS